jgi:hypothetical protein
MGKITTFLGDLLVISVFLAAATWLLSFSIGNIKDLITLISG